MIVIPLVVSAIIIGITSIGDNKQLGKFGTKMILYYGIITVAAVVIGTVLALVFQPGLGAQHYIAQNTAIEVQDAVATAMSQQQGHMIAVQEEGLAGEVIDGRGRGEGLAVEAHHLRHRAGVVLFEDQHGNFGVVVGHHLIGIEIQVFFALHRADIGAGLVGQHFGDQRFRDVDAFFAGAKIGTEMLYVIYDRLYDFEVIS
jgi:hypothetical protein